MSDWDDDEAHYSEFIDWEYSLLDEYELEEDELTEDFVDDTMRDRIQVEFEMLEYELLIALEEGDLHRSELIRDDLDLMLLDLKGN